MGWYLLENGVGKYPIQAFAQTAIDFKYIIVMNLIFRLCIVEMCFMI